MGLEKFLKAVYLYKHGSDYKNLSDEDGKKYSNKIAKGLGHDIKEIIEKVGMEIGIKEIDRIKKTNFDGFKGVDLIRAVNAGYIETRYPTPRPISDTFPIKGTDRTYDPLSSSSAKTIPSKLKKKYGLE